MAEAACRLAETDVAVATTGNAGPDVLEFKPVGKTVKVHTYSPLFGISDVTKEHAREKSPCNDFSFTIK